MSEIAAYHRDGLVVPASFRLAPEEVEALRLAVDHVVAGNPSIQSDRLYNIHLESAPPLNCRGHVAFAQLAVDSRVLDMVEQLIGPDIILWATHLFSKAPRIGREVPWHQDGQYWPIVPLVTCSVWVAIDDCTIENGAVRFIPASHRIGPLRHSTVDDPALVLHRQVDDPNFEERTAQYSLLDAGQISLHHAQLVHGSSANRSNRRRAGFAMRYMPSTSVLRRDLDMRVRSKLDWSNLPLLLVRGQNRRFENDLWVGPVESQA